MAQATARTAKPPAAHDGQLPEEMRKSLEAGQRAAIAVVRMFFEALDRVLPAIGDGSRRKAIIEAAVDMGDRLVTSEHDFLRGIIEGVDRPAAASVAEPTPRVRRQRRQGS